MPDVNRRTTMRCSRIEFKGYRRLADTATNLDGRLTAFVGFNEAGKTSLLQALTWFTEGGDLAVTDRNRSRPPASEKAPVVKVYFELSQDDKDAIADIPMDQVPSSVTLARTADDSTTPTLTPFPRHPRKPFTEAADRLKQSLTRLAGQFEQATDSEYQDPNDWASTLGRALQNPDTPWTDAQVEACDHLGEWLNEVPEGRKTPRDERLATLLAAVKERATQPPVAGQVWTRLRARMPSFVLFADEDRELETTYELEPNQRVLPPAVLALLRIAQVDPDTLWTHLANSDSSSRETLIDQGNDRLHSLFRQAWNQSGVTVRLNTTGTRLEILVKELRTGGNVTNISERSDGLRTFVALVAFLAAGEHEVPPILLIDEAETHLHYDAQADLVSVLLKSVNASQVFYTTHSPGCLPSDLGTGIRVVERDQVHGDASVIKSHFWQNEGPGFSPLLFAMGAGAAAFSMCRQAVLAEGAADMVLLPTLIREATGLTDLEYQVAPGLSQAHTAGIEVEEVAARVVYLADGDAGGDKHVKDLREANVHASRIFQLPPGKAVEDLIERSDYLKVVNGFLTKMGQNKTLTDADLDPNLPISKAFEEWAKARKVRTPSKVEIAYELLDSGAHLAPAGKTVLKKRHEQFVAAFARAN